jgi:hypothetical protein
VNWSIALEVREKHHLVTQGMPPHRITAKPVNQ